MNNGWRLAWRTGADTGAASTPGQQRPPRATPSSTVSGSRWRQSCLLKLNLSPTVPGAPFGARDSKTFEFSQVDSVPVVEKMNSVKTVSGVYSVALHCSAQAQPRPVITWTRRRPGWVTIYWTYFVLLSWNVDVWHSDYTRWIVTNLFIYWLPHCTVTAIKGKLGEKFTFELTPYTAISTLSWFWNFVILFQWI